jgi:hypothetical protein
MQTERSPSNVPSANNARPRRRPSHINLSNVNNNALSTDLLSPRTPRSITKSRRSSVVAEHVQEVFQSESRSSSRRGSLVTTPAQPWPPLLSDSTNSYFQDMIAQDDEQPNPDSPYLRARMSSEDMLGNASGPNASSNRTRSSSLTSLLGSAHLVNLPSFDVHTLYKLKTTKTSKKLDHFFGEHAPHDICIKEIRKEGLKAILESKSPLCYFLYHLLQEYSSENLVCFIYIYIHIKKNVLY